MRRRRREEERPARVDAPRHSSFFQSLDARSFAKAIILSLFLTMSASHALSCSFWLSRAQLSAGLAVLLSLPPFAVGLGMASVPLFSLYPLAKRVTNYPQLVLGFTFNWGALMGWAATYGNLDCLAVAPLYVHRVAAVHLHAHSQRPR